MRSTDDQWTNADGPAVVPSRPHPNLGVVLAWVLLITGIAASFVGAVQLRTSASRQADLEASSTANQVAGSLATALRRDADLSAMARTVVELTPHLTNQSFGAWFTALDWATRYPESRGFGMLQPVTAAELPRFIATAEAETPGTPFVLTPPGQRSLYCLGRIGAAPTGGSPMPEGYDACSSPSYRAFLWMAADTGQMIAVPYGTTMFGLVEPVYEGGTTPPSDQRRARLVGWTGGVYDASSILAGAAAGQTGLQIRLIRLNPQQKPLVVAAFGSGTSRRSATRTVRIDAEGPWVAEMRIPAPYGSLSPPAEGLIALLAGVLLSAMLFLAVRVLVGSRSRALALVDRRTGELRHQALHDALTGLPNRALIVDRLTQMLSRARRDHTAVAALFIDLDNFKDINDTLGHPAGDRLLRAVAERVSGALRENDTVGRLGGDEFVVLAEGTSLYAGPEVVAQRILDVLREPFDVGTEEDRPYLVSASIGIAVGERPAADDLLRDADVALYRAKAAGKNRFVVFEPEMQTELHDRLTLEMELRSAVDNQELVLFYQPTFDLQTVRVTGVEALVRWQHPTRGLLPPDEFIPLAEETGLIIDVGRWVLTEATREAAAWHAAGMDVAVAVNVSPRQLVFEDLVSDVHAALSQSGLDAAALILEITETTIMRDATATIGVLHGLKALGVRIAIDDFGTGYSSLAYLKQFPVDALKIDRSFISGITESREAGALIHTLVQLGKALGLETLAEGIEQPDQFERLRSEACDSGQGFLFARPLPARAIPEFLSSWSLVGAPSS